MQCANIAAFVYLTGPRSCSLVREQLINGCNQVLVVSRPIKFKGPRSGCPGHAGTEAGVAPELFHAASQATSIARRDDESIDAVANDRSGIWCDHAGQARGECLVGDDGGSFEERRKHEDIGRLHASRHLGLRDPPERLDEIEVGFEVGPTLPVVGREAGAASRGDEFAARLPAST